MHKRVQIGHGVRIRLGPQVEIVYAKENGHFVGFVRAPAYMPLRVLGPDGKKPECDIDRVSPAELVAIIKSSELERKRAARGHREDFPGNAGGGHSAQAV